jgi:hypothetical protein
VPPTLLARADEVMAINADLDGAGVPRGDVKYRDWGCPSLVPLDHVLQFLPIRSLDGPVVKPVVYSTVMIR